MSKHNQLPTHQTTVRTSLDTSYCSPRTNSVPSTTMQSAYNQQDALAELYTAYLCLCGTDKHKTPVFRSAIIIITTAYMLFIAADLTPRALFNVTYTDLIFSSCDQKSAMHDIKQ